MAILITIDDPLRALQPWERDWQRRCLERIFINVVLYHRAILEGYTVKHWPIITLPLISGYTVDHEFDLAEKLAQ